PHHFFGEAAFSHRFVAETRVEIAESLAEWPGIRKRPDAEPLDGTCGGVEVPPAQRHHETQKPAREGGIHPLDVRVVDEPESFPVVVDVPRVEVPVENSAQEEEIAMDPEKAQQGFIAEPP